METIQIIRGGQKATLKSNPGITITIGGAIVTKDGEVSYEATVDAGTITSITADEFEMEAETETGAETETHSPGNDDYNPNA